MKLLIISAVTLIMAGCSDTNTLATVNGTDVSKAEFKTYLETKGVKASAISSQTNVLKNYVHRLAMSNAIEQQGVVNLDRIDQQINDYRQQLLMNAYFDKFIADNVNDTAIKNFYSSNAKNYEKIKAHAAHILFRIRSGMSEEEVSAVKMRAFEAASKLKAGEKFADLATRLSEDRLSAKKSGDMGWLAKGSIDPKFSETIFTLKEGEISEPIRTPFGFHIVKVLEAPKTIKLAFDDVKGEIRHQLKSKAKQAELDRLIASSDIEIYNDKLAE